MLVLTRNVGEKLIIDGNIEVMVVEAGGGSVRLGIEAPKDVHIVREELLEEDESWDKSLIKKHPLWCFFYAYFNRSLVSLGLWIPLPYRLLLKPLS